MTDPRQETATTASPNMKKVKAAYQAFTSGDIEQFVGLVAEDFVSRQSVAMPWRDTYRGRQGLRELFAEMARRATGTFEPEEYIDGGDRIVVLGHGHLTPRSSEQRFDVAELHVWHVRDAQLLAMHVFINAPVALLNALALVPTSSESDRRQIAAPSH